MRPLHQAMVRHGLDTPGQIAGRHFAIGCVALEITQRCNLDCTACYLSDLSEAVIDLPLSEVLRRIDRIARQYGPRTNVQITGGDPTLRRRDELVEIVKHIALHDMRPALFTNGIKASRDLLRELATAGLKDVAFHVDMTQERANYASERELNTVRDEYIERARGLGLQILFNTTVFAGNVDDVAMLAKFFRDRARDVHLASFQMIADTGRGAERNRDVSITQQSMIERISAGAGVDLSFDLPQVGHSECNRYAMILTASHKTAAVFDQQNKSFIEDLFVTGRGVFFDRHDMIGSVRRFFIKLLRQPSLLTGAIVYGFRKAKALGAGVIRASGRVNRLTFYIHNFMHAEQLDRARCEACVFMTMTRDGPISMCVHNAKRDAYILQKVHDDEGRLWDPLDGVGDGRDVIDVAALPVKRLKGRLRQARMNERRQTAAG